MKKLIFRAVPGEPNLQIAMPGQHRKLYDSKGSPYTVDEEEYAFLMKHAGHLFHLPKKTSRRATSGKFVSSKPKPKADVPKAGESKTPLAKVAEDLQKAPEESKAPEKSEGQEESSEAKD